MNKNLNNIYDILHVGFSTSRMPFSPGLFANNFERSFSISSSLYSVSTIQNSINKSGIEIITKILSGKEMDFNV